MFLPHLYTPEGFRLTGRRYAGPQDTIHLAPDRRRTITVCNLFSNQNKRIDEIARLARRRSADCHLSSHSGRTHS